MLNIYYGDMPEEIDNYIFNTSVYFDNVYKDAWITKPLSVEMIRDVDKSEVIDARTILSPIFGNMSPRKLSGGTKTLILLANDRKKIFNVSTCGDNCAKWVLEIAQNRKLVINLRHLMNFGKGEFKIKVLNTGRIVHNMGELVVEAGEFV